MGVPEQHKIGSGFGFESTATEVLAGIDLTGKLAIVTGGYSGLGLEDRERPVRGAPRHNGQQSGVRAFALHPGGIRTPLQRHLLRGLRRGRDPGGRRPVREGVYPYAFDAARLWTLSAELTGVDAITRG